MDTYVALDKKKREKTNLTHIQKLILWIDWNTYEANLCTNNEFQLYRIDKLIKLTNCIFNYFYRKSVHLHKNNNNKQTNNTFFSIRFNNSNFDRPRRESSLGGVIKSICTVCLAMFTRSVCVCVCFFFNQSIYVYLYTLTYRERKKNNLNWRKLDHVCLHVKRIIFVIRYMPIHGI